jgi:hypothetical protein
MPPSIASGINCKRAAKPLPIIGYIHLSTAGSFQAPQRGSRHARLIRSRIWLELYYPPLPLLRRPRCHPGQMAVRDSHVSSMRQTHDLRYGASGSRSRIRFMAHCHFRLTMFHSIGLPFPNLHRLITPEGHIQGSYSDGGLTPPITGLSYPETHAFPRGAEQSRFPLVPLRHF